MAVEPIPDVDDSGDNQSGTPHNNAWKTLTIYNPMNARWSGYRFDLVGTQNNIVYSEADTIRCENATDLTITGIAAPASPPKPWKPLRIVSAGLGNVFLVNQSASSSATSRLHNYVSSGSTPLFAGKGYAEFVYDEQILRWRLTKHVQGGWITAPHSAGHFTVSGGGSWTVDAADLTSTGAASNGYLLDHRTLFYKFYVASTDVGATANILQIGNGQWGGFTATGHAEFVIRKSNAGTAFGTGLAAVTAGATIVTLYSDLAGAAWTATTGDNTTVIGNLAFEVT